MHSHTRLSNTLRACARTAVLGASLAAGAVAAQTAADDTLYQQLGAQSGLVTLVDDFMVRLMADSRMQPFFKDTDQKHLKEQLVAQFCEVAGGPCKLKGPDMKKAHESMDINKSNFNALVEVLQHSLDAQNIAFSAQNKLLAKLAPMHRDIINTP